MKNNFKYIVYQTINLVNNKIYIGVHRTNPDIFDGYIGNGVQQTLEEQHYILLIMRGMPT
jgi:hypothetical protein